MGAGHDRQRVLDHQDHDRAVRADPGRPGGARPPRSGHPLLARVRPGGQGADRGPPSARPHRRSLGWQEPLALESLADWELCVSLLAAQAPWWEPGTASGYHAVTQGYLVGELVRRVTGQSLGQFFKQEIAAPLGADFHIGLPAEADARAVALIPPPPADLQRVGAPGDRPAHARQPRDHRARSPAQEWWRRAEIPAANGHGNARSVAAIQSMSPAAASSAATDSSRRRGSRRSSKSSPTAATSSSASRSASAWATA